MCLLAGYLVQLLASPWAKNPASALPLHPPKQAAPMRQINKKNPSENIIILPYGWSSGILENAQWKLDILCVCVCIYYNLTLSSTNTKTLSKKGICNIFWQYCVRKSSFICCKEKSYIGYRKASYWLSF